MAAWLYQMSVGGVGYTPGEYRAEVWERKEMEWGVGKRVPRGQGDPSAGDLVVLFWSVTKNPEPGVYGWGVVVGVSKSGERLKFCPTSPSDSLKMAPIWDDELKALVDQIRGGVKVGTVWGIKPEELTLMREKIVGRARGR
jgi:hypothetical protein